MIKTEQLSELTKPTTFRVVIGLYVSRLGSIPNGASSMVKYVVSFFSPSDPCT